MEENTLYIGNLDYGITEERLLMWINSQGFKPKSIRIVKDRITDKSRGFGFIEFSTDKEFIMAMDFLDNEVLNGHQIKVRPANRPKPTGDPFK